MDTREYDRRDIDEMVARKMENDWNKVVERANSEPVNAVLAIHHPVVGQRPVVCHHSGATWPCDTFRAVEMNV